MSEEMKKYRLKHGHNHYVNGEFVQGGDVVELTEAQFASFRDKFVHEHEQVPDPIPVTEQDQTDDETDDVNRDPQDDETEDEDESEDDDDAEPPADDDESPIAKRRREKAAKKAAKKNK